MRGWVFLPVFYPSEHAGREDVMRCSSSPGKVVDMRGSSQLLVEERFKNVDQGIPHRTRGFKNFGNAKNRFKEDQRIPDAEQDRVGSNGRYFSHHHYTNRTRFPMPKGYPAESYGGTGKELIGKKECDTVVYKEEQREALGH